MDYSSSSSNMKHLKVNLVILNVIRITQRQKYLYNISLALWIKEMLNLLFVLKSKCKLKYKQMQSIKKITTFYFVSQLQAAEIWENQWNALKL